MKTNYFVSQLIVDGMFKPLSSYLGNRSNANRKFRYLCSCLDVHNTTIRVCTYRDFKHYFIDEDHPLRVTYLFVP